MKINVIAPGLYKSGGMRVIYEICKGLTLKGHNVNLYYPIIPFNSFRGEYSLNSLKNYYWELKMYKYNKLNIQFFKNGRFKIKSVPLIKNRYIENADIVIATAWQTVNSVIGLSPKKGKKVYFIQDYETWRGNMEHIDSSYKQGITSVTTCIRLHDLILNKFNVNSEVIYYGTDFNLFNNPNKKLNNPRTILFINHSADKKNTKAAINIVDFIKKKYQDIKIISFGVMPYPGLPDYIENYVNPSEEKIVELYNQSDIFIFTSKEEGFGMPPLEAMSCKTAVVSTNVGAIPEYCVHGKTGFLHSIDDIKGMIESVEMLICNDKLLLTISENGYKKVRETLNWEKAVAEWERFLQNITS